MTRPDWLDQFLAEDQVRMGFTAGMSEECREELAVHIRTLEAEWEQQGALIKEMLEDKARLDWLAVTDDISGMENVLKSEPARNPSTEERKRIWREAIDASIAKAQCADTPGQHETDERLGEGTV